MAEHAAYQPITIEVVDAAVKDWLEKTVAAQVSQPDGSLKFVPITFGAGERFVTSRTRHGIRDDNGVLIYPIVNVTRKGIDPDPTMGALGVETENLSIAKRIDPKTNVVKDDDKVRPPARHVVGPGVVYEVTQIPFPKRVIVNYDLTVQTQYVSQMNAIIEKLMHELDLQRSFVAPFRNDGRLPPVGIPFEKRVPLSDGYVVGFFESTLTDGSNIEEFTDQERILKYQTSFRVPAALQLDPPGDEPAVRTVRTAFGLTFGKETIRVVDGREEFEKIFGKR